MSAAIAQEEEVERLHRLERARSKREHDERIASLDAEHDTMLAEAQSTLHHASKSAEAKHQRRSQWIQTAANNARTQVTEAVAGQKGSQISKVQAQTLKAKRQHETDLSDARKAIAALEGNLLAHKQVYQKLQALALASFRGFPLLYLKIKKAGKQQEPDDSSGGLTQEEFETSVESSIPLKFEDLLLSLKKKLQTTVTSHYPESFVTFHCSSLFQSASPSLSPAAILRGGKASPLNWLELSQLEQCSFS